MKKYRHLIFLSFITYLILSCNRSYNSNNDNTVSATQKEIAITHHHKNDIPKGVVMDSVHCLTEKNISYALYLPGNYDTLKTFSVIYFFDAHARGTLPLKKYCSLAEKYNLVFACSNDSRNQLAPDITNGYATAMMNDVQDRFSIDNAKQYCCGFSGGAKVAAHFAFHHNGIKGIIDCAAPFNEDLQTATNQPDVFLLSGNKDFNLSGFMQLNNFLNQTSTRHQLLIFDGKHDWPDVQSMDLAMQWITDESKRSNSVYNEWKESNSYSDEIFMREQEDDKNIQSALLSSSEEVKKIIDELRNKNKTASAAEKLLSEREINFISMLGYMTSAQSIQQNNVEAANHFLNIYEYADPLNADVFYLRALLAAKSGSISKAFEYLNKASQLGYSEYETIQSQPEFSSLKNDERFNKILNRVRVNMTLSA